MVVAVYYASEEDYPVRCELLMTSVGLRYHQQLTDYLLTQAVDVFTLVSHLGVFYRTASVCGL